MTEAQLLCEPTLTFSVAICAYTLDRWDDLQQAVTSAREQVPSPVEVVVVIDYNEALLSTAKDAWSREAAAPWPPVIVISNQEQQGLSGARNTAIKHARGDVVAFLDDDARGEDGWLARLAEPYRDDSVVATGGSAVPMLRATRPRWWPLEFDWVIGCSWVGLPESTCDVRNVIGCNMSIRRLALEEVGGFAHGIGRVGTRALGCEETDLCIRLVERDPGRRVVFVPEAVVHHAAPASRLCARYFVDRCYSEGLSKALVVARSGNDRGLASERTYMTKTLPVGMWRGLRDWIAGDWSGLGRAGAIAGGLAITAAGFVAGRTLGIARKERHFFDSLAVRVREGHDATQVIGSEAKRPS